MRSIFLEKNHLFLRAPDGGVENVEAMKRAGFGAIFCNIGDYPIDSWSVVRRQAEAAGIVCGPWLRTTSDGSSFSHSRLAYLIDTADRWQAPFIVNSESELKGSGSTLTQFIADKINGRDAAMSVEAWPFDNVSWVPLGHLPFLPQIFPVESDTAKNPEACKKQWHAYGVGCVVLTFGSYGGMNASMFDRLSPFGVYTADDIGGNFSAWAPMGATNPCVIIEDPPEVIMEKIGTADGVKSFITWLKKQPGVQTAHGKNYNENKTIDLAVARQARAHAHHAETGSR